MDSRKEAIKWLKEASEWSQESQDRITNMDVAIGLWRGTIYSARQALSLLTAEPEPCEDSLTFVGKLEETRGMSCLTPEQKASMIDAYASKVADKLSDELREENDRLTKRIVEMQHMIELVLKDEKKLGGISKFRLIGLLPPTEESISATEPKT